MQQPHNNFIDTVFEKNYMGQKRKSGRSVPKYAQSSTYKREKSPNINSKNQPLIKKNIERQIHQKVKGHAIRSMSISNVYPTKLWRKDNT